MARSSTFALTNATLPYVLTIAGKGYKAALREDRYLREGMNIHEGKITYKAVAYVFGAPFTDSRSLLG